MLDDDYKTPQRNPMQIGIISIVCGALGLICCYLVDGAALAGCILGAIGLFVGGYGINYANHAPEKDRMMLVAIAGIGIFISIFAFMFGLVLSV